MGISANINSLKLLMGNEQKENMMTYLNSTESPLFDMTLPLR